MKARRCRAVAALAVAWAMAHAAAAGTSGRARGDEPPVPATRAPDPASSPMEAPEGSGAVEAALGAPFLTPEEAKDGRVRFGRAARADLDTPARAARWAILTGAFLDPALDAPEAPVLDRAEALLWRGRFEAALRLIEDDASMRGVRLRVLAYDHLGRADMAVASALPAQQFLAEFSRPAPPGAEAGSTVSAAEVAEAARAAAVASRLRAPIGPPGSEHQALMAALKKAREDLDRLSWEVALAEAELLYDKDNSAQAQEALQQALAMNPSSAAAWALLGRMAVDAFDMNSSEAIAARLDLLAGAIREEEGAGEAGEGPGARPLAPASPLAAMIRVRAMLRQSDPEQASTLSAGASAAYGPGGGGALPALRCAIEALRFDPASLDRALAEHDARAPGAAHAHFEAGRALAEARQYDQAAVILREAATRAPFWPRPIMELGLLFMQSGRDEDALEALRDACAMDPFNVRADNSLKLVREMDRYEQVESEHFIVRYRPTDEAGGAGAGRPSPDAVLAREMLPILEENHRRVTGPPESVTGGLDFVPARKTFIDLMPNHRWFAVRIAGMPRIHTIAASTGPIIAMEAPRDGPSHSGTYDWPRVLRHEYTHTVGLGKTGNRLPHWFTEAQSVYLEQSPRDYPTAQLLARTLAAGELFDFVEINRAFVRPKKPTDRQLAYAQGHWMYEYMVETFGPRAPLHLMDLYATGVREEEAYARVLGRSREAFMTAFLSWAGEQVSAWGLRPRAGEPTLEGLLVEEARRAAGPGGDADPAPAEPTPEVVSRLLEAHPAHPDVLELACRAALEGAGGLATLDSAPLLERYAAARPVDPLPHKALARLYLSMEMPEAGATAARGPRDAIPHLEWLDAREEKSPVYAAQLAALYAVTGDLDRAWDKALRATRVSPYDARAREKAAAIAIQRNDLLAARHQVEAMMVLEPDRPIHRQRLDAINARIGG